MSTGHKKRPEPLLAGMDTALVVFSVSRSKKENHTSRHFLALVSCLNVLYASAAKAEARSGERPIVCSRIIRHIQKDALFYRQGALFLGAHKR